MASTASARACGVIVSALKRGKLKSPAGHRELLRQKVKIMLAKIGLFAAEDI